MGQPVVDFEITGRDPVLLRRYYADLFDGDYTVGDAATPAVSATGQYGFIDAPTNGGGINGGVGGGVGYESRVLSGDSRRATLVSGMGALLWSDGHALARACEQAEDLGGLFAGAAEPMRLHGVELRDLPRLDHPVLLADDQTHPAAQNVDPLIPLVDPRVGDGLRLWDHNFPRLHAIGVIG